MSSQPERYLLLSDAGSASFSLMLVEYLLVADSCATQLDMSYHNSAYTSTDNDVADNHREWIASAPLLNKTGCHMEGCACEYEAGRSVTALSMVDRRAASMVFPGARGRADRTVLNRLRAIEARYRRSRTGSLCHVGRACFIETIRNTYTTICAEDDLAMLLFSWRIGYGRYTVRGDVYRCSAHRRYRTLMTWYYETRLDASSDIMTYMNQLFRGLFRVTPRVKRVIGEMPGENRMDKFSRACLAIERNLVPFERSCASEPLLKRVV